MTTTSIGQNSAFDTIFGQIAGTNYYIDERGYISTDAGIIGTVSDVANYAGDGLNADPATAQVAGSTLASLTNSLPQIIAGISAIELNWINLERAKQGLPPLSAAQYGPQISVGLSNQSIMLIGAAILAGFILLRR